MFSASSPPNLVTIPIVVTGVTFTTVPVINDTAINISWTPPTNPNGFISSYSVKLSTHAIGAVTSINANKTSYTLIYGGLSNLVSIKMMDYNIISMILGLGIPYHISVGAVNELGEGEVTTATVFTKSLS